MRSHHFELFINREAEARRLQEAIRKRESLLIVGPAGIGKTSLVLKVLNLLSADSTRFYLYLSGIDGMHDLLRLVVQKLYEVKDPTLRKQLNTERITKNAFVAWLNAQSTSRLKGALYRAAENKQYWIFLDHFHALTDAMAKVVKELIHMRDTPVYILARGFTERENGHVRKLYWNDHQRIVMAPLSKKPASELLEHYIGHYSLLNMDLDDFRVETLRLSGKVPGAIVKMCKLAAHPRYQCGRKIKTKLVHINYLMRG